MCHALRRSKMRGLVAVTEEVIFTSSYNNLLTTRDGDELSLNNFTPKPKCTSVVRSSLSRPDDDAMGYGVQDKDDLRSADEYEGRRSQRGRTGSGEIVYSCVRRWEKQLTSFSLF